MKPELSKQLIKKSVQNLDFSNIQVTILKSITDYY